MPTSVETTTITAIETSTLSKITLTNASDTILLQNSDAANAAAVQANINITDNANDVIFGLNINNQVVDLKNGSTNGSIKLSSGIKSLTLDESTDLTTVNTSFKSKTFISSALPTSTTEVGFSNNNVISTGLTIPVNPSSVILTSFNLQAGVHLVNCSYTVDAIAGVNYGATAILSEPLVGDVTENYTVVVPGGYTTCYVSAVIVVAYGASRTIEFKAYVNNLATSTVSTVSETICTSVKVS
jgi:hypothetical protein